MLESGIYGVPPGADFPKALVHHLSEWADGRPPEDLARALLLVNTRRMERRIKALFDHGPPRLLPRVRLVTDLGRDPSAADIPPSVPELRRILELRSLVSALIDSAPDLAPKAGALDLARSLDALLDEMQGEGIDPARLSEVDVSDHSGHWERSLRFLDLVARYRTETGDAPDPSLRLRIATERLITSWNASSPEGPVILAGSTGSRGTTLLLMEAVAGLEHGILILPGFDPDTPRDVWTRLQDANPSKAEDHPQFRFARIAARLGIDPWDIPLLPGAAPPDAARNRLVSLSLRPAPITDQWLRDGPALGDLVSTTENLTLIEAPSPRMEAQAIALAMREAVARERSVALVTPDRMLTRRVTALLARWDIEPDDSAGRPLAQSPPGRLLRSVARGMAEGFDAAGLLSLLKHPLVATGADRNWHILRVREFELWARDRGFARADRATLTDFGESKRGDPDWADWIAEGLLEQPKPEARLSEHVATLAAMAESLAAGPSREGHGSLWDRAAGRAARLVIDQLQQEGDAGGGLNAREFEQLLRSLLDQKDVRDPDAPDPRVMIWGTLEARVQGADLIILGGLNEGTWPEAPAPDPWLNRKIRADVGLFLPERRIGLSAHDYQQAIAAPRVVLSRSIRDAEAEPVPSRWLNRLTNLLGGLPENGGPEGLRGMRRRGRHWLTLAERIDVQPSVAPEPRPAPRPPVKTRPRALYVTDIQKLIRDPYAVYARRILNLRRLNPVHPKPDAALRGVVIHHVLHRFFAEEGPRTRDRLIALAREVFDAHVPWPMARRVLTARMADLAEWFLSVEAGRDGDFVAGEVKGALLLHDADFTLKAYADRIDRRPDGQLTIIDYKTGTPPSKKEMEYFDKQLPLEALIAEGGGFEGVTAAPVDEVLHVGLGAKPEIRSYSVGDGPHADITLPEIRADLVKLVAHIRELSFGFAARRAMESVRFDGDYDQLARYGEWTDADAPAARDVGA